MANYGGTDPGRTGPYWRRQQHSTLPGERTGAELAAINALRAKMGQPPLGGPAQHAAMPAAAPPPGGGYGIPEGPPPGVQPGGLGQLQLPQLLALKAMLAQTQGQRRQVSPIQPQRGLSILPQLHQAVPVKAHVRLVPPRPALGAGNLPSHLRGAYPA